MTEIVNLTPHTVNLIGLDGIRAFSPSGQVARVSTEYADLNPSNMSFSKESIKALEGIKFISTEFGETINLPDCEKDEFGNIEKLFIVSAVLKTACPDRNDLIVPADLVRDEKGGVIGCRAFSF